jgi:predicted DNA-binding protein
MPLVIHSPSIQRKTQDATVTHKKPFTLRLDDDLRERAERVARDQKRTLTSLMTYALEREVRSLEDQQPSPARRGRERLTDRPQAA